MPRFLPILVVYSRNHPLDLLSPHLLVYAFLVNVVIVKAIVVVIRDALPYQIIFLNIAQGGPSNTTLQILSVKGGRGVPPKSVTPFSLKTKSVKGGRGVPPKSVTYFFGPKSGVF